MCAQAAAKANRRDVIEPYDLPVTKGLRKNLKCGCTGNGCEDITIEYPGAGFVVRNTGTHRVRVSMQILSGWDCGRWTRFKLHPGESKQYLSGGYCCPYEAEHY